MSMSDSLGPNPKCICLQARPRHVACQLHNKELTQPELPANLVFCGVHLMRSGYPHTLMVTKKRTTISTRYVACMNN
jgi:hypothetical protein